MRQPSWADIEDREHRGWQEGFSIHAKKVGRINFDKVMMLSGGDETKLNLKRQLRYLLDDSTYDKVPVVGADGAPRARLKPEWVEALLQVGTIAPIAPGAVRGHVQVFAVPEPEKRRYRCIKVPRSINQILDKSTVDSCTFPSKRVIAGLPWEGTHMIALDFASYYDQFPYSEAVSSRMAFRHGSRYFRATTALMGERHSVQVACAMTERFLDFEHRSVVKTIIDNVVFFGSKENVMADAAKFVQRVKSCGGTLNEETGDLEKLAVTTGKFGGFTLDMTAKTTCLTEKSVAKTKASWNNRMRWRWRHFAAHIGLLFWAWGVIELPMTDFFPVMRFVSESGRRLQENPDLWDEPAEIWESVWPTMQRWTELVIENKPRAAPRDEKAELLVATDASAWGWGYCALNQMTSEVFVHGERWPLAMRLAHGDKFRKSTFAEPQAVVCAMCHLLKAGMPRVVRVGTDSTVARAAYSRGYNAHSFDINQCVGRLNSYFGDRYKFEFIHIAGESNPADGPSRGRAVAREDNGRKGEELRRLLGNE